MNLCIATMVGPDAPPLADTLSEIPASGWVFTYPGVITDFSAARNELLRECNDYADFEPYDWAMILDTDERVHCDDHAAILKALEDTTHDMLHVWADDHSYAKPRFFRLPAKGHYKGPTHECWIADPGSTTGTLEGITFSELPKTAEQYKVKAERDRDILEKHTQEHPDDPRWWYYLGDTYSGLGMKEEAKRAFLKCYLLDGWDEEAAWAAYRKATIEIEEGDYAWALSSCVSGMKHHPGMAELPWLAGYCCYKLGRYQHAIWWEMMSVSLNDEEAHTHRINFRHEPALWEGPADVLKHAHAALGNDKAAEFWGKSCDRVMKMRLDKSRAT